MTVATYQPDLVTVAFNGVPITGFAPDTFISAERNNDSWSLSVGSGGDATRAKMGDKSGRVTLTLLDSSASNAVLSAIQQTDQAAGTGVGALLVKDLSGADVVTAGTAWIVRPPTLEKASASSNREWVFESDNLEIFAGGNVPAA
jgi:hypothetical protein